MTSGNGLTVTYTPFNKPTTITRGTASISFDNDPEHQRYSLLSASGLTCTSPARACWPSASRAPAASPSGPTICSPPGR
jgi:hypothetical protein